MQRKCKVCDGWHNLDEPWPEKCGRAVKTSAVYVISDTMSPLKHMGTGEIMESKANFRRATRASGCVEIGNEPIRPRAPVQLDRGQRREAIRRTIYQLRNR